MSKEKILQGCFWLLGFVTCVFITAISIYVGSNNIRHGSYTIFIIGISFIPILFFCAYKGVKLILSAIFD